jgi:hypothetical protein
MYKKMKISTFLGILYNLYNNLKMSNIYHKMRINLAYTEIALIVKQLFPPPHTAQPSPEMSEQLLARLSQAIQSVRKSMDNIIEIS